MKKWFFVVIASLTLSLPVWSLELNEAKQKGLVGEQASGFLTVRQKNAETEALVKDINAKRKKAYEKIALKNKITVDEVAKLAGKKLVDKAAPGEYILGADGTWSKR